MVFVGSLRQGRLGAEAPRSDGGIYKMRFGVGSFPNNAHAP